MMATVNSAKKPPPRGPKPPPRGAKAARPGPKAATGRAQPTRPGANPATAGRQSVRVIAGAWRGRRIEFPDLPVLRPTPDRVRETLFNWLQQEVSNARCLDLFAGSGALGLEALSRGAREVVFVEQAVAAAYALRAQLTRFAATERGRVVEMGARRFLATPGDPFDLLFVDPPFGQGALPEYLPQIVVGGWVKPGGLIYLECERSVGIPELPAAWELLKSKSAGEVGYHLARAKASTPER
jgi:16S rRNA (guanine966-N2)-methyltransferase